MIRLKNLFSVLIFISIYVPAFSQGQGFDVVRIGNSGDFLKPKGVSGAKVQEVYVDSTWTLTSVLIDKNEKPENLISRYDLRSERLEVKMASGIGVLDTKIVKSFATNDKSGKLHEFINAKYFVEDEAQMTGMIEVLNKGKISLYKKYSYSIKKSDYNVALSVGSKDEEVFLKSEVYYSNDNKTLIEFPSKKKKVLEIFGENSSQMDKYIQENGLSVSKEESIISIMGYFNSL